MERDVEVDRAFAHGMQAVLRVVWPHVKDSPHSDEQRSWDQLAASLKRLDEQVRDRLLEAAKVHFKVNE